LGDTCRNAVAWVLGAQALSDSARTASMVERVIEVLRFGWLPQSTDPKKRLRASAEEG
jgi:hypothetical protein